MLTLQKIDEISKEIESDIKTLIHQYIRDNLSIEIKTKTEYRGSIDGENIYKDFNSIYLILDGEVISEVYIG